MHLSYAPMCEPMPMLCRWCKSCAKPRRRHKEKGKKEKKTRNKDNFVISFSTEENTRNTSQETLRCCSCANRRLILCLTLPFSFMGCGVSSKWALLLCQVTPTKLLRLAPPSSSYICSTPNWLFSQQISLATLDPISTLVSHSIPFNGVLCLTFFDCVSLNRYA